MTQNSMIKKILVIMSLAFIVSLILVPSFAFTAPLADQPDYGEGTEDDPGLICPAGDSLIACIPRIYNFALAISGLLAMGIVIFAGYLYVTAGGNGEQTTKAKEMIAGSIAGALILATAYVLL